MSRRLGILLAALACVCGTLLGARATATLLTAPFPYVKPFGWPEYFLKILPVGEPSDRLAHVSAFHLRPDGSDSLLWTVAMQWPDESMLFAVGRGDYLVRIQGGFLGGGISSGDTLAAFWAHGVLMKRYLVTDLVAGGSPIFRAESIYGVLDGKPEFPVIVDGGRLALAITTLGGVTCLFDAETGDTLRVTRR